MIFNHFTIIVINEYFQFKEFYLLNELDIFKKKICDEINGLEIVERCEINISKCPNIGKDGKKREDLREMDTIDES